MPSQAAARLPDVLTLGYGHTESMCAAPSLQFGPVNPALYQLGPLGASCLNTDYLWCFLGCSWIFSRSSSCSAVQIISVGLKKKNTTMGFGSGNPVSPAAATARQSD